MPARTLFATALVASVLLGSARVALAQVTEGDVEIINVRETDPTLGPLVMALAGLGAVTLLATVAFWWLTRPGHRPVAASNQGDQED